MELVERADSARIRLVTSTTYVEGSLAISQLESLSNLQSSQIESTAFSMGCKEGIYLAAYCTLAASSEGVATVGLALYTAQRGKGKLSVTHLPNNTAGDPHWAAWAITHLV